jgi:1,4-dihydroxy-2-naphthoate octaprenyltransferase
MLSVILGLLIASFLVCNEFPDRQADASAGKLNLVVHLSEAHGGWLFTGLLMVAYSGILLLPVAGLSNWIWLGGLGLPFAVAASMRVLATRQTSAIIPAQRWTLLSFVLAALGLGCGMLL